KADPDMIIEDWESLLSDYKIDFSRSEIDEDEDNYVDYLEIKLKENVVSKIADETFQLLFGDRMFCQKFNEIIAADIQGYLLSDYPDLLEKDGKPKRCAYFPEWVQRAVFLRDKGCCAVCLKDLTGLLKTDFHDAIDHIVPLNLGGINDITNFQLICRDCNLDKSGHTIRTSEFYPTYF
ncbi:MAG: HNH endonuclease, partial [Chitinophagales bacterium]|nr:HNH endonuclease [Chitinophagales bacterium]